jgi:hypothetical protein
VVKARYSSRADAGEWSEILVLEHAAEGCLIGCRIPTPVLRTFRTDRTLMPSATLQLNIIPKRMLTKSEAAHHCGRSVKRFDVESPVHPLRFPNGDLRWDVQDLDAWLNSLKAGAGDHEAADVIARLS